MFATHPAILDTFTGSKMDGEILEAQGKESGNIFSVNRLSRIQKKKKKKKKKKKFKTFHENEIFNHLGRDPGGATEAGKGPMNTPNPLRIHLSP